MSTLVEFPGNGMWEREFSFLGGDSPITHTLLVILRMAENVRQLRALHDSLPENCRLFREDFIHLESFWQQYFSAKAATKTIKNKPYVVTEADRWVLNKVRGDASLVWLYRKKLWDNAIDDRNGATWWPKNGDKSIRHSNQCHFWQWFKVAIFGAEMSVDCFVRERPNSLIVHLNLLPHIESITENLTHCMLTKMPKYIVPQGGGPVGSFVYVIDLDDHYDLKRMLWSCIALDSEVIYRIEKGFLSALSNECRTLGIPIERDIEENEP